MRALVFQKHIFLFLPQIYVRINQDNKSERAKNEDNIFRAALEAFQKMENGKHIMSDPCSMCFFGTVKPVFETNCINSSPYNPDF